MAILGKCLVDLLCVSYVNITLICNHFSLIINNTVKSACLCNVHLINNFQYCHMNKKIHYIALWISCVCLLLCLEDFFHFVCSWICFLFSIVIACLSEIIWSFFPFLYWPFTDIKYLRMWLVTKCRFLVM